MSTESELPGRTTAIFRSIFPSLVTSSTALGLETEHLYYLTIIVHSSRPSHALFQLLKNCQSSPPTSPSTPLRFLRSRFTTHRTSAAFLLGRTRLSLKQCRTSE